MPSHWLEVDLGSEQVRGNAAEISLTALPANSATPISLDSEARRKDREMRELIVMPKERRADVVIGPGVP